MYKLINNVLYRILENSAPNFDYGSFRSLSYNEDKIVVICRNGGDNLVCSCEGKQTCIGCIQKYKIPLHPLYLDNKTHNRTYCHNYFRIPEEYQKLLTYLGERKGKLPKIDELKAIITPDNILWDDISNALTEMKLPDPICVHSYEEEKIDQRLKEIKQIRSTNTCILL